MGGNPEWDNRMMDSLKNFDLSSPEIKQQFGKLEWLYCSFPDLFAKIVVSAAH